jgi:hypothetical protein
VEVAAALTGLGVHVRDDGSGAVFSHVVTYVVGQRVQKWALLGGEIQGLSGETAIAVRLLLTPIVAAPHTPGASNADAEAGVDAGLPATPPVAPPLGSFRRHCNVCKQPYALLHAFYHQVRQSVRHTILYRIGVALAALLLGARCPLLSPPPSPHSPPLPHLSLSLTPRRLPHQLCPRCGDFNLSKRLQTADLRGYRCLVTGGRVRIG